MLFLNQSKFNRQGRIPLVLLLLLALYFSCGNNENTHKPNIIVFFTDDQGYADLGCYGAEGFETPNFDMLAKSGIRFTDFYVPATVCTPSRAGLLTGRYPKRAGLHEAVIYPFSEHGLSPEEFTMAEMFQENGYATACIGKWHLGHKEQFMPNNHGFDYYYGVPYSNDMDSHFYKHNNFQSPPLPVLRNTELKEQGPPQKYLTKMFTEEAVAFIKKERNNPFFLYLPHCMPHVPLHASENFNGKSELGIYGDVIMELDWSMGEIIKTLKEEGIYENTMVVFTSDNGPSKGSALPLRGKKATTWEGGQRVPGIISWPDRIPAKKVCNELVNTMDLFPTFEKIIQAENSGQVEFDGIDISELLENPESTSLAERPFYYYSRDGKCEAIRLGKWKLHIDKTRGWNSEEEFPISLYNLENDISEQNNLAEKYPEIVKKLENLIKTSNH
ncbi:MAG: sulfatase [Draconibacterium sp.]|nr:sulfatase [Draconibacterium sp.]